MTIMVTGGAGFIGCAVVKHLLDATSATVINVDKLTYAGSLDNLKLAINHPRHHFERVDICDREAVDAVLERHKPDGIMHLAAESHVDRSILDPGPFVATNVIGTYTLLEAARDYWHGLNEQGRRRFRFHHVSTDEVYGDLADAFPAEALPFTEESRYQPNNPYSATKASADHLVRAWNRTYGLPVVISNCSNNYGPYQFPEKLIPLATRNALMGRPIPVYGAGQQVRDWLYVEDHARALYAVLKNGCDGSTYNIGANNEVTNLEVVHAICRLLEEMAPSKPSGVDHYQDLVTLVKDRPGHDQRYAIDAGKLQMELGWRPQESFESGLRKTLAWYLDNPRWHPTDGTVRKSWDRETALK